MLLPLCFVVCSSYIKLTHCMVDQLSNASCFWSLLLYSLAVKSHKHFLSSKHVMRSSIFSSVHNLSVFFFLPVSPPAVSADAAMFFSVWREIMGASERWLLGYKCCRSWQRGETSRNMYPWIAETQNISASEQKQILLLGDAGNNASRVEKLGNIGETCARYRCFWKRVSSFSQVTFHEGFSTNFPKYTGSTLSRPQVLLLCRHSRAWPGTSKAVSGCSVLNGNIVHDYI